MFDFKKDDFLNSSDFVQAISRSVNSERRINKTSVNELGQVRSSLTTTDIGELMTGALNTRNIFYSQNFLQKSINSSLDSLVTSFSSTESESIVIESPEGFGLLNGSQATNRILSESLILKKGYNDADALQESVFNLQNAAFAQYQSSSDTRSDNAATSAGAMPVALESILRENGTLAWYQSRHRYLRDRTQGQFDIPVNGFIFSGDSGETQTAYVSASLIELLVLLEVETGVILGGSFGLTAPSNASIQGSALQGRSDSNSDHNFGRAFDIRKISRRGNSLVDIHQEQSQYRQQLEIFLEALNTVPEHLKPDLITIHPGLASIYGISSGFESPTTEIKRKYTGLQHVDFETSQEHRGHIHISFSAERAGIYTGPNGVLIQSTRQTPRTPSVYAPTPYIPAELTYQDRANWYKNYADSPNETISRESLYELLRTTVMTDESAALFMGIVGRESGFRPVAINGGWRRSNGTYSDEYSIGLFQVNLLVGSHGGKRINIPFGPRGDPYTVEGWRLTCANHPSIGTLNSNNVNDFLKNILGRINQGSINDAKKVSYASRDIWVPWNQVSLLYSTILKEGTWTLNSPKLDPATYGGNIYSAWGDYGGGKGFMNGVDYDIVIGMYLRTGKPEVQFQEWFKSWFDNVGKKQSLNRSANPAFFNRLNSAPANPGYYSGPNVVSTSSIPYPSPRTVGEMAVNIAFEQILKPYEKRKNGDISYSLSFDCSGLTRFAWYRAVRYYNSTYNQQEPDIVLPWKSFSQFSTLLTTQIFLNNQPPEAVLKAGDLIVKNGHVAMYVGGTKIIHALNEQTGIVVDDWKTKERFNGTQTFIKSSIKEPGSVGFWEGGLIYFVRVKDISVPISPLPWSGFQG
jgi:cell wall-associated NlpC family hydrolase